MYGNGQLYRIGELTAAMMAIAAALPQRSYSQTISPVASAQHRDENGEAVRREAGAIVTTLTYNSDVNADVSGGARRGAAYLQRVGLIGDADLARAIGWNGATAHVSVQAIAGTGLSSSRVGNLLTVSGIEAAPALRLFNLWIEQKVAGTASVRVGQFTAGQEFAISPTANLFVNSTFGWPGSFAVDLPGGGPAYPVSVPGIRVAKTLNSARTTVRAAVFAATPPGRNLRGIGGWRFRNPPLAIAEVSQTSGGDDPSWTVLAGGWASFDRFADLRSPTGRTVFGNQAMYMIGDARLWSGGGRSVHAFARFTLSPRDRNLINRYFDAGLTFNGIVGSRPQDTAGLAIAAAGISSTGSSAASGSQDVAPPPAEVAIEASYQLRLSPSLYLQPNAQVIFNRYVSGPDPDAWPKRHHRAIVLGVRTSLRLSAQ